MKSREEMAVGKMNTESWARAKKMDHSVTREGLPRAQGATLPLFTNKN